MWPSLHCSLDLVLRLNPHTHVEDSRCCAVPFENNYHSSEFEETSSDLKSMHISLRLDSTSKKILLPISMCFRYHLLIAIQVPLSALSALRM